MTAHCEACKQAHALEHTELLVHEWFDLSYSNYLVLPRSVMQSMPIEWQRRMVACLQEIGDASVHLEDMPPAYRVQATTFGGKFMRDPYADYERGRRRVALQLPSTPEVDRG